MISARVKSGLDHFLGLSPYFTLYYKEQELNNDLPLTLSDVCPENRDTYGTKGTQMGHKTVQIHGF